MAGTFTHWMIVEEALDKMDKMPEPPDYFPKILGNNHFVVLGAAGPDYPYLNEILLTPIKHHSWADRMHYENVDSFVHQAMRNLLNRTGDDFDICLSWLCGYVSHVIADAVIHPVVNAIVGPYMFNADEHRHCEMTQDSFIFHHLTGNEIRYAAPEDDEGGYLWLLQMCSDPDDQDHIHPAIRSFWMETLQQCHPGGVDYFDKIKPDDWHESFLSVIGTASDPFSLFRHMGEKKNLIYKKTNQFTEEETQRFIRAIRLPGGQTGDFKKDAFDKAVEHVLDVWTRMLTDVKNQNADNCLTYLKNWNLDTGVDAKEEFFWI